MIVANPAETSPGLNYRGRSYREAKGFFQGTQRSVPPAETLERVRPTFPVAGITRIANITHLDRIGVPTTLAIRPNGQTLSNSSGKGFDLDAAKTSAVMEAIELFHAEEFTNIIGNLGDAGKFFAAVGFSGLGLLLRLEHGLEVHFRQQDRREAGARADVRHDGAQIRVDHLRADDADDALHLLLRHVADLEDAGLLGLDEEQHLVLHLGGHRGGDGDLEDAFGDGLGRHAEVDVDLRLLLLEQDLRRVGLLQRQVLEVHALDIEHGGVVFGHGCLPVESRIITRQP